MKCTKAWPLKTLQSIKRTIKSCRCGAGGMAQEGQAQAALPEEPGSIPNTCVAAPVPEDQFPLLASVITTHKRFTDICQASTHTHKVKINP